MAYIVHVSKRLSAPYNQSSLLEVQARKSSTCEYCIIKLSHGLRNTEIYDNLAFTIQIGAQSSF